MSDDDDFATQLAIATEESLKSYSSEKARKEAEAKAVVRPKRHITVEQEIEAARNICRRASANKPSTVQTPPAITVPAKTVPDPSPPNEKACSLIEEQNDAYSKALAIDAENAIRCAAKLAAQTEHAQKLADQKGVEIPDTPPVQGETVQLAARLPNGQRITKVFKKDHSVFYVYVWIAQHLQCVLSENIVIAEFSSRSGTISDAGVVCNTLLHFSEQISPE